MLKSKYLAVVLAGCLAPLSVDIAIADGEVQILPYERFLVADGRGIATLSFTVRNQSGSNQQLIERLVLPEAWVSLSSLAPFVLSSGGQETRLVHISVPNGTRAGVFPVKYLVQGKNNSNINGQELVRVKVESISGAELSHTGLPGTLLAGESYEVGFKIKNTGNKRETYAIRVRDKDGFVKSITPRSISLAPNAEASIDVKGQVQNRLVGSKSHRITLVAKSSSSSSELSVGIPTIPRIPVGLGRYHKLKGDLSLSYQFEDDDDSNWVLNYRAQGVLDSKGKHYLSLNARTSGSSGGDSSDFYDEDYLQILHRTRNWETTLGHQSFYINQLTGHSLSGVGAEVQYSPRDQKGRQPLKVRAFKGKSRSNSTLDEETSGIEAKYAFNKGKFQVGLSFLTHKEEEITYDVKSITGEWRAKYANLRGGYAWDNNDDARSIDFDTHWNNFGFNLSHREGGPKFSGGYEDRRENQAGLSWRHKNNSVRVTATETRTNLDHDTTTQISDISRKSITASKTLGDRKNMVFSVGYRTSDEVDLRTTSLKTLDRTVDASFLQYKHRFINFDLSAKLEYGDREDRLDESGSGSRQELALDWKKFEGLDLRMTYSRNDNLNFSGDGETFGVNGSYEINGRQQVSSYWQRNDGETSSSDSFGLSYSHRFFNRHQIGINASYIDSTSDNGDTDNDSRVFLTYTLPLDVPLRRRRDVGSVKGRAVYGKTKKPAENMVLQLGNHYAVTDSDGRFYYPDIFAKDYTLQIDNSRGTVGNYVLNNSGAAVKVDVKANKMKELNIALEPGASLTGSLRTFEIDKAAALQKKEGVTETGGLGGVLVELQPLSNHLNQDNLQRTTTDGNGEFNFLGVPSGKWQVVIVDKLPDDYKLERRSLTVDLKAEETKKVFLKALPRIQTIERVGPVGGFSVSG